MSTAPTRGGASTVTACPGGVATQTNSPTGQLILAHTHPFAWSMCCGVMGGSPQLCPNVLFHVQQGRMSVYNYCRRGRLVST